MDKFVEDLRARIGRKTLADIKAVVKKARAAGKSPDQVKAIVLKRFKKDTDDAKILVAKYASLR